MKQTTLKASAFLILYLWFVPTVFSQEWEMQKSFDGIEVFTRQMPDDPILELKIEFSLATRIGPLVSILDDVDNYCNWVYKSLKYEEVESNGMGEGIYYGIVDFPWPMDDRDYVIESTTDQDPHSKVVTIESFSTNFNDRPVDEDYVRIPMHFNQWKISPVNHELVDITYLLKSDPGGSIPAWLVNLAIDKGAIETIQNLKKLISSCEQNTKLAYIQEK